MIRERLRSIQRDILSGKRKDYAECEIYAKNLYSKFINKVNRLLEPPQFNLYTGDSPVVKRAVKRMIETEQLYLSVKHACKFMQ